MMDPDKLKNEDSMIILESILRQDTPYGYPKLLEDAAELHRVYYPILFSTMVSDLGKDIDWVMSNYNERARKEQEAKRERQEERKRTRG